jgi:hypothetical protein
VEGLECALAAEAAAGGDPLAQARAYLRAVRKKLDETRAPPGFFAAIAEDPEFVAPLRDFRHLLLERVFRRCPDPALATVAYLASEGLVHAKLTDPQAYDPDERGRVFEALERLLDAQAAPEPHRADAPPGAACIAARPPQVGDPRRPRLPVGTRSGAPSSRPPRGRVLVSPRLGRRRPVPGAPRLGSSHFSTSAATISCSLHRLRSRMP